MHTLARNVADGVIDGMAQEAVKLGTVDEIVPWPQISRALVRVLERGGNVRKFSKKGD